MWVWHLPVGHGGVEYLVAEVLHHFGYERLLHGCELLRGVILRGGAELFFPLLSRLGVGETYVHRHAQLHLRGEAVGRYGLVELVVTDNFARHLQVAAALHELQSRLGGIEVLQLVVEHGLHGSPAVGGAVGDFINLNGFQNVVVDVRACHLNFDGAGCE